MNLLFKVRMFIDRTVYRFKPLICLFVGKLVIHCLRNKLKPVVGALVPQHAVSFQHVCSIANLLKAKYFFKLLIYYSMKISDE